MNYEVKTFKPATEWPVGLSELLDSTQTEEVQMLALSPEQVMSHQCQTGAFTNEGELVGYIAVTYPFIGEIGALIVSEDHRKQGLGHMLVAAVTNQAVKESIQPIAFCNALSESLFKECGYVPMDATCIPGEALALCTDCKSRPDEGGCCDTVYTLPSEVQVKL